MTDPEIQRRIDDLKARLNLLEEKVRELADRPYGGARGPAQDPHAGNTASGAPTGASRTQDPAFDDRDTRRSGINPRERKV